METTQPTDDDFFSALTAPLEVIQPKAKAMPVVVEDAKLRPPAPQKDLAVGDFMADRQASFIERAEAPVADREALEGLLGEPYPCRPGQQFQLCGRHLLVIDEVILPPQLWTRHLASKDRSFVPWPDVLAADLFHHTAPPVLMVQPDHYIAGLILNYYLARHGQEAIKEL